MGVTSIGSYAFRKDGASNPNLTSIINPSGRTFNFGNIINGVSGYNFVSGTVDNVYGNVNVIVS